MFIVKVLEKGAIGLLLALDSIIYDWIGKCYNIFMAIAGARLLSADAYMKVANKVYAIVGVLMLFVLSYSILRSIVDPDKHLKEELGANLVRRILIAVVGLALTPVLFNLLYQAQGLILESNILGNLFFNDEVLEDGTDPNAYLTEIGGSVTATSLWQAFFYPSEASGLNPDEVKAKAGDYLVAAGSLAACAGLTAAAAFFIGVPVVNLLAVGAAAITCIGAANNVSETVAGGGEEITLQEAYSRTAAGDNFNIYVAFLDNLVDDGEITYTFILSSIAGGFCLYAFISFSIDMGVRAAKLAYLQIIAPIPLIMQVVSSNKSIFDDYVANIKNTFLEVFIRISVVYVVVYIICHLPQLFSSTAALWGNKDLDGITKVIALALLILGLVAFCRQAPEIISETLKLPKGNLKLGLREKLANGGAFTAGGILGAAATSGFHGAANAPAGTPWWKRVGRGARGFLGAGFRAGWNQLGPGEDKTEAKKWSDMVNVASKASRAQDDAQAARDQRKENRDSISSRIEDQRKNVVKLENDYEAATDPAERERLKQQLINERKKLQELEQDYFDNTEIGNWAAERKKRIHVWATGSFDLSLEDAAIKMGSAAGDLQDKLRSTITAKGSDELKAAKKEWDRLEAETVSEYKAGYTQESYAEGLRQRKESGTSADAVEYRTKRAAYESANAELRSKAADLEAARASGDVARISAAEAAHTAAEQRQIMAEREMHEAEDVVVKEFDKIAKKSEDEFTKESIELQHKRSAAKKIYEMMADAEIQVKLAAGDADYVSIVNNFLRENADLIQNHGNMTIPIEVDAHGNVVKSIRVSEWVEQSFGKGAIDGAIDQEEFKGATSVKFGEGDYERHFEFDTDKQTYREFTKDASGAFVPSGRELKPGEISTHLTALMRSHPGSDLKIDTGINRGKDTGKTIKNTIPISEPYVRKKNLEREKEGK